MPVTDAPSPRDAAASGQKDAAASDQKDAATHAQKTSTAPSTKDAAAIPALGMVWFIGAGPGDPELITVKGQRLISQADLVLYAGSLVPEALVRSARPDAHVADSAPLTLEQTHALMAEAARKGQTVARVHTGDPSLYGAIHEQMVLLEKDGIPFAVVPGVTAAFAAAAAARLSLTLPETAQSFVITRLEGRTPVPQGQTVQEYARHKAPMAVYLSAGDVPGLAADLRAGGLDAATPILMAHKVGWPDEKLARTTLGNLVQDAAGHSFSRQTIFLVLPEQPGPARPSRLYAEDFSHGYREK